MIPEFIYANTRLANLSIIVVLALPHPRIQHIIIKVIIVFIYPFAQPFSLIEPFFIMSVKLALLYILGQLDIISLSQDCQEFVISLSDSLIGIINEIQNFHENFSLT